MKKSKSLIALIIFDVYLIVSHIILLGDVSTYFLVEYYHDKNLLLEIIRIFFEIGYLNMWLIPAGLILTILAYYFEENKKYKAILMVFIIILLLFTIMNYFLLGGI